VKCQPNEPFPRNRRLPETVTDPLHHHRKMMPKPRGWSVLPRGRVAFEEGVVLKRRQVGR
jgi:hypothetical protein